MKIISRVIISNLLMYGLDMVVLAQEVSELHKLLIAQSRKDVTMNQFYLGEVVHIPTDS